MRVNSLSGFSSFVVGTLYLTTLAGAASAAADYSDNLHWKRGQILEGYVNAAVEEGDFLYVAFGCVWTSSCGGSLGIFDMTTEPLQQVGEIVLSDSARDLVVADGIAYVAGGGSGLTVVDVSTPSSPSLLSSEAALDAQHVEKDGSTVFLLTPTEFRSYNVTTPGSPLLLDSLPQGGTGFATDGSSAYLLPGLTVLDVSDPSDLALVVEDVIGESAPGAPLEEGQAVLIGTDLWASFAYEVVETEFDQRRALELWDVSAPSTPVLVDGVGRGGGTEGIRLAVDADLALTNWKDDGGTALASIATAGPFEDTGTWDFPATEILLLSSGEALVFGSDEVHWFHVGPLGGETIVGQTAGGASGDFEIDGDYAFIADDVFSQHPSDARLQIVDVSDPANPNSLGEFFGAPTWPIVDVVPLSNSYAALSQFDDLAFEGDFEVVDVTNPAAPAIVGSLTFNDIWPGDVLPRGSYAFMSAWDPFAGEYFIRIISLADPAVPVFNATQYETDGLGRMIPFFNRIAFSAGSSLTIFTDGPPGNLSVASTLDLSPFEVRSGTYWDGQLHYHATNDGHDYLLTVDVTLPFSPQVVGSQLLVRGGTVQSQDETLVVGAKDYFDATDPGLPVPIPGFRDGRDRSFSAVANGYVLTSGKFFSPFSQYDDLFVYDLACPTPADVPDMDATVSSLPIRVLAAPNPGSREQLIRFEYAGATAFADSPRSVDVVDASGRLVRVLTPDGDSENTWKAVWDGRDGRGRPVANGVYWVRLLGEDGDVVGATTIQRVR